MIILTGLAAGMSVILAFLLGFLCGMKAVGGPGNSPSPAGSGKRGLSGTAPADGCCCGKETGRDIGCRGKEPGGDPGAKAGPADGDSPEAEELRRRLAAEQKAFSDCMNYSANVAYGGQTNEI